MLINRQSTFIQNLGNRKGQIALFVALIFQILFLFFAMVINVGMLVHHKINLQNSVDLAAYYGAMKQAENMNAIAHINYQIRQSWKLLSWRYRMLGSAGEWKYHPFNKEKNQINLSLAEDALAAPNTVPWRYQIAPSFCITYLPFKEMPPKENTCRDMADQTPVQLWNPTPIIASHQSFTKSIRAIGENFRASSLERCRYMGSFNYYMLGKFIVAFNMDQSDRLSAIAALSKATSVSTETFYDIDGQSVTSGMQNTLLNNLTSANKAAVTDFRVYNSLGADGCNAQGLSDTGLPAKWLTPVRIYPGFRYIDTKCESTRLAPVSREMTGYENDLPQHRKEAQFESSIAELAKYIGYRSNLNDNYNFSVGVEKNPWCMAYMGVTASTQPKVPFSPFGTVTLKARAFYKPFGGRIGPWYYKMWRRGSSMSEGDVSEKTDSQLPPRVTDMAQLASISGDAANNEIRAANHSRFVGDTLGLKSYKMLAYYGEAIYHLDSRWNPSANEASEYSPGDTAPAYAHWDDLPFRFNETSGAGDLLAWDFQKEEPARTRFLEVAAILPDTYDITYYSIEPDFYHNYYLRLKNGYFAGPGKNFTTMFRPDLGYRKNTVIGNVDFEKFSIKDQYTFLDSTADVVKMKTRINEQFTFVTESWQHLLTSWAPVGLTDYSLDSSKFGKCSTLPIGSDKNRPEHQTS
ncbi:MAG: Tad domain-containing protein [Bdellovibrio sp.]